MIKILTWVSPPIGVCLCPALTTADKLALSRITDYLCSNPPVAVSVLREAMVSDFRDSRLPRPLLQEILDLIRSVNFTTLEDVSKLVEVSLDSPYTEVVTFGKILLWSARNYEVV